MRKPRSVILLLVVLCLLLSGGTAYWRIAPKKEKKEVPTLKVWEGEKSLLHLPLYVALEEGFFTEQNVKIQLFRAGGSGAGDPYDRNLADIILADPVECLYRLSTDPLSPSIVATLAGRSDTFLLGREKTPFNWEGLKDKTIIAYPPETGPGFTLEALLRANGLAPQRDLTLYYRIPADLRLGVFKSGSGSYIQLAGPQALQAEAAGTGYIAAALGRESDIPAVLCTAWPGVVRKQPGALQGFVNGIHKAQLWMQHEPELALQAAKKHFGCLYGKTRDRLVRLYLEMDMWRPAPWLSETSFEEMERMLAAAGQLVGPVKAAEALDNTFARRAAETIMYIPEGEREKGWLQKLFSRVQ